VTNVPGRHDFQPPSGRRRWAPTALDAVVAATPATSLFAALGLAGGGYLVGREGVAACGAVVGAFGLIIERFQTRGVRVRLRRERARYRTDLHGVGDQLRQLQRELSGLRDDMNSVRSERDAVRGELQAALHELSAARTSVSGVAPIVAGPTSSPIEVVEAIGPIEVLETAAVEPGERPSVQRVEATEADVRRLTAATRAAFGALVPGQSRSPIATGGIPMLRPGPSESVPKVIDLRSYGRAGVEPITEPMHTLSLEAVDALVYAALAEADADELTLALEVPGEREVGRHAGPLHTGDAHHAGDYARNERISTSGAAPTLFVVKRGRHAA
jgi:hypothetical protein